ncbi:MAG: fatty acid desaturase-domain-containing protein, partial [Olpidium bornovanus]
CCSELNPGLPTFRRVSWVDLSIKQVRVTSGYRRRQPLVRRRAASLGQNQRFGDLSAALSPASLGASSTASRRAEPVKSPDLPPSPALRPHSAKQCARQRKCVLPASRLRGARNAAPVSKHSPVVQGRGLPSAGSPPVTSSTLVQARGVGAQACGVAESVPGLPRERSFALFSPTNSTLAFRTRRVWRPCRVSPASAEFEMGCGGAPARRRTAVCRRPTALHLPDPPMPADAAAAAAAARGLASAGSVLRRASASNAADSDLSDTQTASSFSPSDSPRRSASSASLWSLSSVDATPDKFGRLVDAHGNDFHVPDFTIKDIRDAIPKHCFERSPVRGFSYIARDVACIVAVFAVFHNFATPETVPSYLLRCGLWALYTFLQGLFGTGLWVIAHECGHGAFSPHKTLNDFVGWVLHSALLVPYFSWRISHRKHHKATGNMEKDMVFVPRTRARYAKRSRCLPQELTELTADTPAYTLMVITMQQLIGWPNYLLTNISGHNFHERQREGRGKGKRNGWGGGVNHFDPRSPLFEAKDAKLILLSDLGLAIVFGVLAYLGNKFGWANLAVWYFVPYLWVNHWLGRNIAIAVSLNSPTVAITYLQHTDPTLPHYTPEQWDFVRGAAATIDRDMGFIGRSLFHGIAETHVLHHYVSTIPFYNAEEASAAIKAVMGKHYRAAPRRGMLTFISALYHVLRTCQWVEPSEDARGDGKGILFFRNKNGLGTEPAKWR